MYGEVREICFKFETASPMLCMHYYVFNWTYWAGLFILMDLFILTTGRRNTLSCLFQSKFLATEKMCDGSKLWHKLA